MNPGTRPRIGETPPKRREEELLHASENKRQPSKPVEFPELQTVYWRFGKRKKSQKVQHVMLYKYIVAEKIYMVDIWKEKQKAIDQANRSTLTACEQQPPFRG